MNHGDAVADICMTKVKELMAMLTVVHLSIDIPYPSVGTGRVDDFGRHAFLQLETCVVCPPPRLHQCRWSPDIGARCVLCEATREGCCSRSVCFFYQRRRRWKERDSYTTSRPLTTSVSEETCLFFVDLAFFIIILILGCLHVLGLLVAD